MLDDAIKTQLQSYFSMILEPIVLSACLDDSPKSLEMKSFLEEVASLSDKIHYKQEATSAYAPSFFVKNLTKEVHINFAMIPMGHEFTSFVLALLQVGGHKIKLEDDKIEAIKSISTPLDFTTYASLECMNCPDIIQALNTMALINPNIKSTAVDGAIFLEEVEKMGVKSIPTIYLNGKLFAQGRMSIEDILSKLGAVDESKEVEKLNAKELFDVLVIGSGPAGASAAIYSARKGIKTGIVADRMGGQILETVDIENFISVKKTEGAKLASHLEAHIKDYDVDIMIPYFVKSVVKEGNIFQVELNNGAFLKAKAVIVATGAKWRRLNVEGEEEYMKKGVAFCPHCDGPLYKGKNVAVIGGGNSGLEGAIDLAGIVNHVTVVEFLDDLKADEVLQKKVYSLPNVTVIKSAQLKKVLGDTKQLTGIEYLDRNTQELKELKLDGIFIQIGLMPNTEFLGDLVELNRIKEVVIDDKCKTSLEGLFAAGDLTTVPYKQIIIAMGEGAKAAISAFNYLSTI